MIEILDMWMNENIEDMQVMVKFKVEDKEVEKSHKQIKELSNENSIFGIYFSIVDSLMTRFAINWCEMEQSLGTNK